MLVKNISTTLINREKQHIIVYIGIILASSEYNVFDLISSV